MILAFDNHAHHAKLVVGGNVMGTECNADYLLESAAKKEYTDDVRGGLEDLTQAILLSPKCVKYYRERADLLFFESDHRLSTPDNPDNYDKLFQLQLDDLNMILELGTELDDLTFARDRRANCFRELGRHQDQLTDLNWLIDHEYDIPYIYRWRAACEFQLGHFENALKDYSVLLQSDPDDTSVLFERARVYYAIQRYQEALDDLNKLLSTRNGMSFEYSHRARCYYRLGKMDDAREDFIKFTELAGGTPLDISAAEYMRILWSED